MKYPIYSIRDKFRGFMQPTIDFNDNTAKRGFAAAVNNSPEGMGYSPADFDLHQLGEFDSDSGRITGLDVPKFICNGMEVFNEKS